MKMTNKWSGGYIKWINHNIAYLSVVFSWQLPKAHKEAMKLKKDGYIVIAGGPAVAYNRQYLADVAHIGGSIPVLWRHNPEATFTTRGCPRRCEYCIVHSIEPKYIELDDWPIHPIICDNNIMISSDKHFNSVIDKLKPLSGVDFNQGLDARFMTQQRADRLAELDLYVVRLAWDNIKLEKRYLDAFQMLRKAGIPARKVRTYVLIGYKDTPEDALYRLDTVRKLGAWPNPMRYQPLDELKRNSYIAPNWTDRQLKDYMRYWSKLAYLGNVPFSEYRHDYAYINKKLSS